MGAICQYLAARHSPGQLDVPVADPAYGAYLNWLHHADATLTFPQTLTMRYYYLEPSPEKQAVGDDYAKWFIARLRRLDTHLERHDYLVDGRFTIADIAVGYALYLACALHLDERFQPRTRAYLERLKARPAFQRADDQATGMALNGRGRPVGDVGRGDDVGRFDRIGQGAEAGAQDEADLGRVSHVGTDKFGGLIDVVGSD